MCCRVKTCCCGMSLKKGTAAIGILGIIGIVLNVATDATSMKTTQVIFGTSMSPNYRISFYCGAAVAILFSVLLLVATFNKTITSKTKRRLVLPWLIYDMIGIIGVMIASVAIFAMGCILLASYPANKENVATGSVLIAVAAVMFLIFVPIAIYFWIVVHSYYQELNEQKCDELPRKRIKEDMI